MRREVSVCVLEFKAHHRIMDVRKLCQSLSSDHQMLNKGTLLLLWGSERLDHHSKGTQLLVAKKRKKIPKCPFPP